LKKLFFLITIAIASACSSKKGEFAKIKTGMKSTDVVKLVGAPVRTQPMGVSTWWLYNDPEKHMVIINSDTVANCTTQKDAIRIMDDALRMYDSLHKKKNL
jgi:hypothetical protein